MKRDKVYLHDVRAQFLPAALPLIENRTYGLALQRQLSAKSRTYLKSTSWLIFMLEHTIVSREYVDC